MKHQKNRWLKRFTAVAGAITLGLLGTAAPAAANLSIDPAEERSLIIHKFEEPASATGAANDGTAVVTTGLTPLNGVEFTIQQVGNYDLTTAAGWEAIETMDVATAEAQLTGEPMSVTTGSGGQLEGQAAFTGLDLGLYLVQETGHGVNLIPNSVAPFLVTIPTAHADRGWIYEVHTYPKNSVTSISKSLNETGAHGLGSTVTWSVTAELPQLPEGDNFTGLTMSDQLNTALEYQNDPGVEVTLDGDAVPTAAYTVTTPTSANNNTLSVDITDRAYLADKEGATLSFEFVTTVVGIGSISNTANIGIEINDVPWDEDTNTVEGFDWGSLVISKYNTADVALAGAQFQIFRSTDDAENLANPVVVNGESTFTSGATDGLASVAGLRAGKYWVVETQAPDGYIGHADPIEVIIEAGDGNTLRVVNSMAPTFQLPLTGGMGTAVFALIGLGIVALAVVAGVRHQRRKQSA